MDWIGLVVGSKMDTVVFEVGGLEIVADCRRVDEKLC